MVGSQADAGRDAVATIEVTHNLLGRMSQGEEGSLLQVIVCQHEGHSMGLVVDRILDIVEQEVVVQKNGGQHGILGSAVIQQRVTELLDLPVAFSSVAFA